jgi:1,4-dihydroxy-6-naphthoate synthase
MKLTFAFSPCPNDTFMFEPMVNARIDLLGFDFAYVLDDVENLNKSAILGLHDITKLSFNAYTRLSDIYQLLTSGSALGNNCGPLLISKRPIDDVPIEKLKIAVPGFNTTAYLLLKYAFPNLEHVQELLFSDIENAVANGKVDAGVIIHENRFTYSNKGLHKIIDLGEYWENKTNSPIPLGGIAVKRSLPEEVKQKLNYILFQSIKFAFENPTSGIDFIKSNAQEMDENVMFSHINLYVNNYSKDLGDDGKNAINVLFKTVYPNFTDQDLKDLFVR